MSYVLVPVISCVVPNRALPISVDYAKLHIKAISDVEDSLVEGWIRAAAQYFEHQTGRAIMRSTFEYWLDYFPVQTRIELPRPPLQSVLSVQYISEDGTRISYGDGASPETVSWRAVYPQGDYAPRGWIEPIYGAVWPTVRTQTDAVIIRYEAGYAAAEADVPDLIKVALLKHVGAFDQFRSEMHVSEGSRLEQLPFGAEQIIDGFKHTSLGSQVLSRL
jgi:uncharacterized phiE125 gp8 family phage protein